MSKDVKVVYTGYLAEAFVPGVGIFVRNVPRPVDTEMAATLIAIEGGGYAEVSAKDKKSDTAENGGEE
jgi:hypothetical protein